MTANTRDARSRILEDVDRYFLGPGAEDEIIEDNPWDFYHTGMLWPPGEKISGDEDDQDVASGMDDDASEGLLNLANCAQQSALGISAQLPKVRQSVALKASWGEYIETSPNEQDKDLRRRDSLEPARTWQRRQGEASCEFDIDPDIKKGQERIYFQDGIEIRKIWRATDECIVLTVVMINRRQSDAATRYEAIVYQPRIELVTSHGEGFTGRVNAGYKIDDDEFWSYELLYRNSRQFAIGHGCSAEWDETATRVTRVSTTWLPRQLVPKASASLPIRMSKGEKRPVFENSDFLRLDLLARQGQRREVIELLRGIAVAYGAWITDRNQEIPDVIEAFGKDQNNIRNAAEENVKACRDQLKRIEAGIDLLAENDKVWVSFCLGNETMAAAMSKARPDRDPQWRIFQLAFILVALPSTIFRQHPERNLLDLIWFPTGGGKTEAYLGLSAILLFYRRLSAKTINDAKATAVITRYTLRLLTIQQFERATSMICAANLVSQKHPEFAEFPSFTIGLFVGGDATPNSLKVAEEIINNGMEGGQCTTLPFQHCPWCKTELLESEQYIDVDQSRMITPCANQNCEFHGELPIAVVDEEIYANPPSIVIGTVDKFAMMAWVPEISNIFGTDSQKPDLIIQDELHLITGALGTVTALYETAIDYLTETEKGPIKIVGSTATIRRASDQVKRIFNRDVSQFPPPGISATDSFFYQVDDSQDRLYVGIHAQGRSPKHSLARLAANIHQANIYLSEAYRDAYYTLIIYFNSLRELGGALVLLDDDVPRYLESLPLKDGVAVRPVLHKEELTSQLTQEQLGEILSRLNKGISDADDDEPVDVVLSTNMISVGVDVGRLNVMIINGQPKNTAEYIQASSRVGREQDSAGLVFTLYNWTRPRDRSHYERFKAFHLAFYRHVESASVTPYAARARDRALRGVLFSMARQSIRQLSEDSMAGNITEQHVLQEVKRLANYVIERARTVDEAEEEGTAEDLDYLMDAWVEFANTLLEEGRDRVYWQLPPKRRKEIKRKKLESLDRYEMLKRPNDYSDDDRIPIPMSMRDVEPPINVQLIFKK